ncbi:MULTISPECIES: hypothetical protein [unclassified Iodobacter]|uniref:hypothetical protein n=1 Tax=unclassified Iodobacter TaxID=235634 RepID=UPI0025DE6774|nr:MULTISPECIES: hypothetical protein [unclassified Iodobacter]MDW5419034.1 hypothetical protein [Iodobacter sp. CM08]
MKKLIIALAAACVALTSVATFAEGVMNKDGMTLQKKENKHHKARKDAKKHQAEMKKEAPKEEMAK